MRFFNTVGPVNCADHYCLPPLSRLDMDDVLMLIAQKKYFLLHAPRQTGKTTCLLALADYLNARGEYHAVYANIEAAQAAREDVTLGMGAVVTYIANFAAERTGDPYAVAIAQDVLANDAPLAQLGVFLSRWCEQLDKPLVLLLDEVDALVGDTLISLLRQLRAGYPNRPGQFPQTVMLCGVRDIQDYRMESAAGRSSTAVYNINAASILLGNFTPEEVHRLVGQHTAEMGQVFEPEALDLLWSLTWGQPWLVNALAAITIDNQSTGGDWSKPIPAAAVIYAKEQLLEQSSAHLNNLLGELNRPNVRQIAETILAGSLLPANLSYSDIAYVRDIGLATLSGPFTIANPIYTELVRRELT